MNLKIVPCSILFSAAVFGQTARNPVPAATADIEVKSFHSSILGREETIQVWLPPGYHDQQESARVYPVIYLLDGDKMLGSRGPNHDADLHLGEALARLIGSGELKPIIAVAVGECKEGEGRRDEYLPYEDSVIAPNSLEPRGKAFPEFLVAELLPYVSARYRVTGDPQETAIGGLSYSAIAALYALINKPATFQLGFLESPSLQAGNGQLLRDTQQLLFAGKRIAIGVGTMEAGKNPDPSINKIYPRIVEALAGNLRSAYFPPEVRLTIDDGAGHEASAWARRIPDDLVFLFGTQR